MPIIGTFQLGGEQIAVIVDSNNIMFNDVATGTTTTIQGLKLNKPGVIREHPDLKDDDEWRKKAIDRLKKHVKTFQTETKKLNYVKDELVKHGYIPLFKQKAGFRPTKF